MLKKYFNKNPKITFNLAYSKMLNVFPQPIPASKDVPQWWKNQESHYDNNRDLVKGMMQLTVKKCQAVFDGMASGYYILAPVDIYIDTTGEKAIIDIPMHFKKFKEPLIGTHSPEQISKYPLDRNIYSDHILRIHPVWIVSTPKGYSTLFTTPMHQDLPIHSVPAVVDSDTFMVDGLISYFVKKNFKGVIKQGTPILQVIPFKREPWQSVINENFDKKDIVEQRDILRSTFENGYRKKFWSKKEYK